MQGLDIDVTATRWRSAAVRSLFFFFFFLFHLHGWYPLQEASKNHLSLGAPPLSECMCQKDLFKACMFFLHSASLTFCITLTHRQGGGQSVCQKTKSIFLGWEFVDLGEFVQMQKLQPETSKSFGFILPAHLSKSP